MTCDFSKLRWTDSHFYPLVSFLSSSYTMGVFSLFDVQCFNRQVFVYFNNITDEVYKRTQNQSHCHLISCVLRNFGKIEVCVFKILFDLKERCYIALARSKYRWSETWFQKKNPEKLTWSPKGKSKSSVALCETLHEYLFCRPVWGHCHNC